MAFHIERQCTIEPDTALRIIHDMLGKLGWRSAEKAFFAPRYVAQPPNSKQLNGTATYPAAGRAEGGLAWHSTIQ